MLHVSNISMYVRFRLAMYIVNEGSIQLGCMLTSNATNVIQSSL